MLASTGAADAQEQESFVIMRGDRIIGAMTVDIERPTGGAVEVVEKVRYQFRNNGRGPTVSERITIAADSMPVDWRIVGKSTYGGRIAEHFAITGDVARWESGAEHGVAKGRPLYVPIDASPWRLAVLTRALARSGRSSLEAAPGGHLTLERLRDVTLPSHPALMLYSLSGADLSPDYVLVDRDGRLFAHLTTGNLTVRAGFEAQAPRLRDLALSLQRERAEAIQKATARRYPGPIHIRNVRIFDAADGTVTTPRSVVVADGRITTIASGIEPQAGETVIDGEGGTLVPGLFDMHMHDTVESGPLMLAAGVTHVRDMANDNALLAGIVGDIKAGRIAGPQIVRNGMIEGQSEFSTSSGIRAATLPEALAAVRWYADRGYRQVKLYSSIRPEWIAPIATEARRLGIGVTGHIPAFATVEQAIEAGYQDIAHVNQLVLGWLLRPDEDTRTVLRITALARAKELDLDSARVKTTLDLMASRSVALDTTIMVLERLLLSRAGQTLAADESYIAHMPLAQQRLLRSEFTRTAPGQRAALQAAFDKLVAVVGEAHRRGIQLLPGTDDVVETGFGMYRELELYVRAGIPSGTALQLATLKAAAYLGVDQSTGSIERGKRADFFLVPGDPVADISAIRKVRLVMRGELTYQPSDIYRAVGITPFVDPPRIIVPEAP